MQRLIALVPLAISVAVAAELAAPGASGIAWGHFHFSTKDADASRKFWTTLGATEGKALGNNALYLVKDAVILVAKRNEVAGGTEATVVNHVGFKVKDLDGTVAKVKDAGFRIITAPDAIAKNHKANVMGPDEINIELVGEAKLDVPIASHHVHFYDGSVEDTRAWYVKTFGAAAGKRDQFEAADLPGINLSFSAAKGPVKGTKGLRARSHRVRSERPRSVLQKAGSRGREV